MMLSHMLKTLKKRSKSCLPRLALWRQNKNDLSQRDFIVLTEFAPHKSWLGVKSKPGIIVVATPGALTGLITDKYKQKIYYVASPAWGSLVILAAATVVQWG